MSAVVLLDTSVLLEYFSVPGKSKKTNRVEDVFAKLAEFRKSGCQLLLPVAAIIETGNHISKAKIDGDKRKVLVEKFVECVLDAIDSKTPWTITPWPENLSIREWITDFPSSLEKGLGFADLSIIKEWERTRAVNPHKRVLIYSLDHHLSSFDTESRKKKRTR